MHGQENLPAPSERVKTDRQQQADGSPDSRPQFQLGDHRIDAVDRVAHPARGLGQQDHQQRRNRDQEARQGKMVATDVGDHRQVGQRDAG